MPRFLRGLLLGALIVIVILPLATSPASAQDRDYDLDVFYRELAPYGDWSEHPRWGYVWRPQVSNDWRPYSRGHWVYTEEYGWYWEAEEPWGWAAFHYGRWVPDEDEGWIWIPGTEWGPAWVVWRDSDEYVGWAPLGPDAQWGPDGALSYDERYYDDPRYASAWCFVQPHYMTTPGLFRFLAPPPRNVVFLRRTRPVFGYRRHDRRVVNGGFDVRRYERLVGRPVPIMRLRGVDNPREHGARRGPGGRDIPVFRPRIIDRPDGARHRPPNLATPDRRFERRGPDQPRPDFHPRPSPDYGGNPDRGYVRRAPDQPFPHKGTAPPAGNPPAHNPHRQPFVQPGPGSGSGAGPKAWGPSQGGAPPGGQPPSSRTQPQPDAPAKREERRGAGGQPDPK